jgi:cytoskeletal protein RodZ
METVGEFLKSKRIKKKLSVEDISKITKIREKYIASIEENDFSEFSAKAYTKGFIISYAKAVEEDPREVLSLYHKMMGEDEPAAVVATKETTDYIDTKEIFVQDKNIFRHKKIFLSVAIVVILFFVFLGVFMKQQEEPTVEDAAPILDEVATADTTAMTDEAVVEENSEEVAVEQNTLLIEAIEDTWIKVKTDTLPAEEVILKENESKTWLADDVFRVSIGNAGGIRIKFNEVVYDSLGKRGEVIKNKIFKRD